MFMKSVGMATLSVVAVLPSCIPKPKVVAKLDYSKCPCPSCQAGLPTKELHWVMLPPQAVIVNDNAIAKIKVTDDADRLPNQKIVSPTNERRATMFYSYKV